MGQVLADPKPVGPGGPEPRRLQGRERCRPRRVAEEDRSLGREDQCAARRHAAFDRSHAQVQLAQRSRNAPVRDEGVRGHRGRHCQPRPVAGRPEGRGCALARSPAADVRDEPPRGHQHRGRQHPLHDRGAGLLPDRAGARWPERRHAGRDLDDPHDHAARHRLRRWAEERAAPHRLLSRFVARRAEVRRRHGQEQGQDRRGASHAARRSTSSTRAATATRPSRGLATWRSATVP
jgi:hypothetical protein